MQYVGNKQKIQKHIIPFIHKLLTNNTRFIDLFTGGLNIVQNVKHNTRIANDNNKYLIALYKEILFNNWQPEYMNYTLWEDIKYNKHKYADHIVGYAGIVCTFNSIWFKSYAHNTFYSDGTYRNFQFDVLKQLYKYKHKMLDVELISKDYREVELIKGDVVYCDPPYKNSADSIYNVPFYHYEFHEYIRQNLNKAIFLISEYEMPNDFISVWNKPKISTLSYHVNSRTKIHTENLFIHESQLHLIV